MTSLADFKNAHSYAFRDLAEYAADDPGIDGARLAPVLNAQSMSAMIAAREALRRYIPCTIAIDTLHDALCRIARDNGI